MVPRALVQTCCRRHRAEFGKAVDIGSAIEEGLGGLEAPQGACAGERCVSGHPRLIVDLYVDVVVVFAVHCCFSVLWSW